MINETQPNTSRLIPLKIPLNKPTKKPTKKTKKIPTLWKKEFRLLTCATICTLNTQTWKAMKA